MRDLTLKKEILSDRGGFTHGHIFTMVEVETTEDASVLGRPNLTKTHKMWEAYIMIPKSHRWHQSVQPHGLEHLPISYWGPKPLEKWFTVGRGLLFPHSLYVGTEGLIIGHDSDLMYIHDRIKKISKAMVSTPKVSVNRARLVYV